MDQKVSGETPRRSGARGRSPGAGLVPPGSAPRWVRLERPANDNIAPLRKRIARAVLLALPWMALGLTLWSLYRLI